jgi:DnaJ-domain-containing protein 1
MSPFIPDNPQSTWDPENYQCPFAKAEEEVNKKQEEAEARKKDADWWDRNKHKFTDPPRPPPKSPPKPPKPSRPVCPFTVLGLEKGASIEDVKRAFKQLALKHHPDKPGGDTEMFKKINIAYQTISAC